MNRFAIVMLAFVLVTTNAGGQSAAKYETLAQVVKDQQRQLDSLKTAMRAMRTPKKTIQTRARRIPIYTPTARPITPALVHWPDGTTTFAINDSLTATLTPDAGPVARRAFARLVDSTLAPSPRKP